jgi:uroporphyrin-III C-methyltransferase
MTHQGFVSLVGAGPGDPELLTVKGLRRLREADVVVYDALVNPDLLNECRADAELIYAGKRAGQPARTQASINALLIAKARAGLRVVRLKGGDPFVFGRGGEEAEALQAAGVTWEVVPGVTSAIGVPAYAGIPITHRAVASSVAFVTGHEDPARAQTRINWRALAEGIDTLVFLMGIGRLAHIAEQLIGHGRAADTPAAVIRWGTTPEQETVTGTLATIAAQVARAGLTAPAILIVGEVVRLRERLSWFDTLPRLAERLPEQHAEPIYVVREI